MPAENTAELSESAAPARERLAEPPAPSPLPPGRDSRGRAFVLAPPPVAEPTPAEAPISPVRRRRAFWARWEEAGVILLLLASAAAALWRLCWMGQP